ncbi:MULTISPECIES: hypothetical protein [unclassified Rhizobium]|uniref:hypothetical protein n=1 Tax=unclassified Rhizobium TaxID=2613769 RepID=UPI0007EE9312|nr:MULTISPECIES: hypothetical protein [unclassified Rhizobium]
MVVQIDVVRTDGREIGDTAPAAKGLLTDIDIRAAGATKDVFGMKNCVPAKRDSPFFPVLTAIGHALGEGYDAFTNTVAVLVFGVKNPEMLAGAESVVLERCGTRRTYVHVRIVNTETFMMGLRIGWDMSQPRAQPSELRVFTTIAPLAIMGLSLKKHRGGFQPIDAVFFYGHVRRRIGQAPKMRSASETI